MLRSPFPCKKRDPFRTKKMCFINCVKKSFFRFFSFVFINRIWIQSIGELKRLRTIAYGEVALIEKLCCLCLLRCIAVSFYLDCIKKIIAGDLN